MGKVLDPTGKMCVDATWSENFNEKLEDTANMVASKNARFVNQAGHTVGVRNASGYLGKWGTLAGSAVVAVAGVIGLKYAWDYFTSEEDSKKSKGKDKKSKSKDDSKSGCLGSWGSDKQDKKKGSKKGEKKEGEDDYLYWIVGLVVFVVVMALPTISAALGLESSLGVVTGPISTGQNFVLGLVGMGGASGLPQPSGLAK